MHTPALWLLSCFLASTDTHSKLSTEIWKFETKVYIWERTCSIYLLDVGISFGIIISSFIHFLANFIFLHNLIKSHCIYIPYFHFLFINWWICRLISFSTYCEGSIHETPILFWRTIDSEWSQGWGEGHFIHPVYFWKDRVLTGSPEYSHTEHW